MSYFVTEPRVIRKPKRRDEFQVNLMSVETELAFFSSDPLKRTRVTLEGQVGNYSADARFENPLKIPPE